MEIKCYMTIDWIGSKNIVVLHQKKLQVNMVF